MKSKCTEWLLSVSLSCPVLNRWIWKRYLNYSSNICIFLYTNCLKVGTDYLWMKRLLNEPYSRELNVIFTQNNRKNEMHFFLYTFAHSYCKKQNSHIHIFCIYLHLFYTIRFMFYWTKCIKLKIFKCKRNILELKLVGKKFNH